MAASSQAQRFEPILVSRAEERARLWTVDNQGWVAGDRDAAGLLSTAVSGMAGGPMRSGDFPGRGSSAIISLSNVGYGVGRAQFDAGPTGTTPTRAAAFSAEQAFDLGTLPGDAWSQAHDGNDRGVIVGFSFPGGGSLASRAFIWVAGVMTQLPVPSTTFSSAAYTVNNTDLAGGYAAGRAYVWYRGVYALDLTPYLPAPHVGYQRDICYVVDINDRWDIAVQCTESRASVWWREYREVAYVGSIGRFSELAADHSAAHVDALNAAGCAVGEYTDMPVDRSTAPIQRPFVACSGNIASLYEVVTPSGRIVGAADINDRNEILAKAENNDYYLLRPAP